MLKVAVCWSGLTKGFSAAVSFNKKLFDDISNAANNEIEFDHFCQFWNKNNKYLYDFDETLFDTQFKELDGIATENIEYMPTIIDILDPKMTVLNNFNDFGKQLLGKKFLALHPKFTEYKTFAAQHGRYIHKTENDISNTSIDFREIIGYTVHEKYCRIVKHFAQFYAFEQVVSLAKVYDTDYDVIIKMRYDIVLEQDDILNTVKLMYKAKSDNSIMVEWFELPEHINGVHVSTTYLHNTNIQTVIDTGKKWCISDVFFHGSAACMYKLVDNIVDNVYTYYCFSDDKDVVHQEQLWFNEICNKNITCNAYDNSIRYAILRNTTDFDIFKQFNCNVRTYVNEYKNKLPKSEPNAKLSDVTWDDPRRYFVPPDNYILASMVKLILRY